MVEGVGGAGKFAVFSEGEGEFRDGTDVGIGEGPWGEETVGEERRAAEVGGVVGGVG